MPRIEGRVAHSSIGPDGCIVIEAHVGGEEFLAFRPGREVVVHLHPETATSYRDVCHDFLGEIGA